MDRIERIYKIVKLLREHKSVALEDFLADLEMSKATFKRDLEYLRDRFQAPIIWDRELARYRIVEGEGTAFELPGLWFNPAEIHALLSLRHVLVTLGPGILTEQLDRLLARMHLLLDGHSVSMETFEKRVRIQRPNARTFASTHFLPIATATMQRRRIRIEHHNRFRNETIVRDVSPQRLSHYRDNWYVDAWCHLREELRSFGLSAVMQTWPLNDAAHDVSEQEISATLDSGYGIFSGAATEWAELVFTPERAQWVIQELWHAEQTGWIDPEGYYHLRFPYSDPREVSADILRHVPHVRIAGPDKLRTLVTEMLTKALQEI